jgi:hypothetical protein
VLASACGGPEVTCGEGTVRRGETCVAVFEPGPACAPGTIADPSTGQCVSEARCEPGTNPNPTTGACESSTRCGSGTRLDLSTGQCLAIIDCGPGTVRSGGECLPAVSCGAGTSYDAIADACRPVQPCQPGTVLDPESGLCVSDLACGPEQVAIDGVCLPVGREIAAEADAEELTPDRNDPGFGGVAELLVLEPSGERAVFLGTIGRPVDLDGDGALDQDVDVWRFEGTAGQVLRIRALSAGVPQPAFVLRGPGGYERSSEIGYVADAQRWVVLPRTGAYELAIAPAVWLAAGIPLGGPDAGYIGVVEVVPRPTPTSIVPGETPETATALSGRLLAWTNNVITLAAPPRTAVVIDITAVDPDVAPAVLAFDAERGLVTEVALEPGRGTWIGTFVASSAETTVYFDWLRSNGTRDAFVAELVAVPVVEAGELPPDSSVLTPAQDIPALSRRAYAFSLGTGQVSFLEARLSPAWVIPNLQLLGPSGTELVVWGRRDLFFYATPGDYVVFVENTWTSDRLGVPIAGELVSPIDLGTLEPDGAPADALVGDVISGGAAAWLTAAAPAGSLLSFRIDTDEGSPNAVFYSRRGVELREATRTELDHRLHVFGDGAPVLVKLEPPVTRVLLGCRVSAAARAATAVADPEPNDQPTEAVEVGALPATVVGTVSTKGAAAFEDRERDVWSIELPQPLAPGQSLGVWLDVVDSPDAMYGGNLVSLIILGPSSAPLASIPGQSGGQQGLVGSSVVAHVGAAEGTGPFYAVVTELSAGARARYVLHAEVVDVPVEREVNDVADRADGLGPVPAAITGYWNDVSDTADAFVVDVPEPGPPGASLVARVDNLEGTTTFNVTLLDELWTELATGRNTAQLAVAPPGRYFVRLVGPANDAPHYRLRLDWGPMAEIEPNDSAAEAHVLPPVAPGAPIAVDGVINDGGRDVFVVDVTRPLTSSEGLAIRAINLSDASNVSLHLYGDPDPDTSLRVATDTGPFAWVVSGTQATGAQALTPPFGVVVAGGNFTADRYRLLIEVTGPAESEPNGTSTTADRVGPLPFSARGVIDPGDDDAWMMRLNADLAFTEALEVTARNLGDSTDLYVELLGSDFATVIASASGSPARLVSPGGMVTDFYYVRLSQTYGSSLSTDVYEFTVRIGAAE